MTRHHSSNPLEGITLETHQLFFQPGEHSGIVELVGWWVAKNDHNQWCIFHFTSPMSDIDLWHYHSITDDRLRFFEREKMYQPASNEEEMRHRLIEQLFGSDND